MQQLSLLRSHTSVVMLSTGLEVCALQHWNRCSEIEGTLQRNSHNGPTVLYFIKLFEAATRFTRLRVRPIDGKAEPRVVVADLLGRHANVEIYAKNMDTALCTRRCVRHWWIKSNNANSYLCTR